MKLWIDDIRNAPDESWNVCRNITSAIKALNLFWPEITEISFDHDISHQIGMGKLSRPFPCDETFQAVALHFVALATFHMHVNMSHPIKVGIHTSNPAGAKELENILRDYHPTVTRYPGANRLELEL